VRGVSARYARCFSLLMRYARVTMELADGAVRDVGLFGDGEIDMKKRIGKVCRVNRLVWLEVYLLLRKPTSS
jgi:hypothetical protein